MSKISVAMTTYNGAAFLELQLQSLLEQTRLPDEVIICDDGSQDNTVDILKDFIKKNKLERWTVFENSENHGYVENFRKAMSLTTGDVVFLCDQDDIWNPRKIEIIANILERDTAILALASGYSCIDSLGNPIGASVKKFYTAPFWSKGLWEVSKVRYGRILYFNMAQGCSTAYRRSLVDRYCATASCNRLSHDWALNMMAYDSGGLYFLNKELIHYRIHEHNTIGVVAAAGAITHRIPRLENYADEIVDALQLPLRETTKNDIRDIVNLTHARIAFLREKRMCVWCRGFAQHLLPLSRFFLLQYIKDLVLVLLKRTPVQ